MRDYCLKKANYNQSFSECTLEAPAWEHMFPRYHFGRFQVWAIGGIGGSLGTPQLLKR